MATIEIRDILDENGKTIFPRTHVDAVIGLKDLSFFELVEDTTTTPHTYSVKLKDSIDGHPLAGLWTLGFMSAGGIGSGGGGGGGGLITSVKGVADLGTPIVTESLTETFSAKAVESIYEAVQNANYQHGASLSITSGASYLRDSNGNLLKDSNGNYLVESGQSSKVLNLLNENGVVVSSVELPIPTISSPYVTIGDATISLGDSASLSDIGIPDWAQDDNLAFNSLPSLYIGKTPVKDTNNANDTLIGINGFTNEASDDVSGDKSMVVWEPNGGGTGIGAWHFKGNIYADGWIAAGGAGVGGGGGSVFLNQNVADVSVDMQTLENGDVLRWNDTSQKWENGPLSATATPASANAIGGIMVGSVIATPTVQSISSVSNRYYYVQCDSYGLAFVNVPWDGGGDSASWGTYSSISHTIELTVNGVSYVLCENGYSAGGGVSSESDPVFTASPAYSLDSSHVTALMGDDYALKTGANTYNFLVNTLKFSNGTLSGDSYLSLPRPKWVYTDNSQSITPTIVTKYLAYRDEIPNTLKNPYALTFGISGGITYTYDGSVSRTLTASELGAVTLAGAETITGAKTFTTNLSVNAEVVVNSISSIIQDTTNNSALFNYGGRLTQQFNAYGTTINLRVFNASEQANILSVQTDRITVGSQLIPNYTTGINLGGSSANQRWSTIYGLNANLTGNLVMSATSYIDIGPVRIEYDSVNKAIHIKKADDNDNNEYGLYCEGFIASGGAQATS